MTRQLAIMTKAGIPIIKSFEVFIMGIRKHPRLKILAIEIKQAIEGASHFQRLSETFLRYLINYMLVLLLLVKNQES